MKASPFSISVLVACLSLTAGHTAEEPPREEVVAAMKRAAEFYRTRLSVEGGYASRWRKDSLEGETEHGKSESIVSIQPPGTTTVGLSALRAFRSTGEPAFLEMAMAAAVCLTKCQLATGGWASDFDFDPEKQKRYHLRNDLIAGDTGRGKRRDYSTLDDNKTQSAMLLLIELVNTPDADVSDTVKDATAFAMDKLISHQAPIGAWPQQFGSQSDFSEAPVIPVSLPETYPRKWPKENYVHFYTLNDNNLLNVMKLLLRAHTLEKEGRYLDSAKQLGNFLLLAQHTGKQRGWSQQYDHRMEPVWARKFEPPAVSSVESMGAIETLFELWIATGDSRYRNTLPDALDWLESSRLPDGQWARFYELETNRPLYCEADTYRLTYDDSDLPTHYGFKISESFQKKIDRMRKELARERESIVRSRTRPYAPDEWAKLARDLRGKTRNAMKDQTDDGYWLNGDMIDAKLFSTHINRMADYVEALTKADLDEPSLRN